VCYAAAVGRKGRSDTIEAGKFVPSTVPALRITAIFEKEFSGVFQLEHSDWKK
jgi:DNA-binding XRE family transcriptional regulator